MRRFNPEKELSKIRNGNKKKVIISICTLLFIIAIGGTYALYQVRHIKKIVYTVVAPFNENDLDIAVYVNGIKQNEPPDKNSGYNFVGLVCDVPYDGDVHWDEEKRLLEMPPMSIPNKCNAYFINDEYNDYEKFDYNGINGNDGSAQEYTISKDGIYKIELWGASGGNQDDYKGGAGAYTSGLINLTKNERLYFYIGSIGGFNNNGSYGGFGSTGGGASDVRLTNGNWDDFDSLKSRIMVAAGGGGADNRNTEVDSAYGAGNGGYGGGLIGGNGASVDFSKFSWHSRGTGGIQNKGGEIVFYDATDQIISAPPDSKEEGMLVLSKFGIGGFYGNHASGGSGYYGGGGSVHGGSGGGSSFISGHLGCDAIEEGSTSEHIIHTGNSTHYSGKVFTNTVMIDGEGYYWTNTRQTYIGMPTFDETGIMQGNTGNGYARITYLGS